MKIEIVTAIQRPGRPILNELVMLQREDGTFELDRHGIPATLTRDSAQRVLTS